MTVEKIVFEDKVVAIVARDEYREDGLSFFTPEHFPFQLGMHIQNEGFAVKPHRHIVVSDEIEILPQEIFHILEGEVRVDLYNEQTKIESIILKKNDTILVNTGHSITFLKKGKMLIIKQGPYKDFSKEFIES